MKYHIPFFNKQYSKNIAPFLAFRLCLCSTVKSRSKREKLSLKTLMMPRVRLDTEFGSFSIYATILSCSLTSGIATLTHTKYLLFPVLRRLCRKANKKTEVKPKMKKVVYSIKKVRNPLDKLTGLGFINDEGTLFCKCVSKNGKKYTRAFDDVEKYCHPIIGKDGEYKGYVSMYYQDVPLYNKEHDNYDVRDIEVEYSIWFKIV